MEKLWLGASVDDAKYVFLLPNVPVLPDNIDRPLTIKPNVSQLIELNGNHWRKIFTIMAKLVVVGDCDWRTCRDEKLFDSVGVAFSLDQVDGYKGVLFIVGNTFREVMPISDRANEVGSKCLAHVAYPVIWCPYLDYRQFPNILIETLREYILEK
ncbi:DUF6942 family protein [Marinomonas profundimaris]|uniref:Uncharacterized protein n=1 Tax=Marinomonas profundimaris TaxID=1208321 RepID=W1RNI7_9GAMM|nr:hypothetical protein [Marinomonas profundimaris]ETI57947.1 hypothetical protein D104_17385 [Marinomonas profundimaris]